MTTPSIRVFLVEDSLLCLTILKRMLATSPEIEVVGTARNGKEALELIPKRQPHVICTDLEMPLMDGLELTQQVSVKDPRAVLVLSNYVQQDDTYNISRLVQAGAVDVFPKPRVGSESEFQARTRELIDKIKILAGVVVLRRRRSFLLPKHRGTGVQAFGHRHSLFSLVAIGASAGGPQALQQILTQLPANFPMPILCVQHISKGFMPGLVEWLTTQCRMKIKIAESGERLKAGTVYFPQEDTHLELDAEGKIVISKSPPINGHRPSANVTFRTAARLYGGSSIGILLTGMGQDGVQGMEAIAQAGGITIAQDEKSCVVFGMPKHAIESGVVSHILPLSNISSMLMTTPST